MKVAMTIAGSDSSGGAGIQADIKTMTANGVFAMSAITALTAQNTTGVQGIMGVPADFLKQQIDSCITDIRPDSVKIGMVAQSEIIKAHAQIRVKTGRFTFTTDYSFTGERYKQNDNEETYPAIYLWNACASFDITDNWNCYLKVDNILDYKTVYHDNYYIQSRKITVGTKFKK